MKQGLLSSPPALAGALSSRRTGWAGPSDDTILGGLPVEGTQPPPWSGRPASATAATQPRRRGHATDESSLASTSDREALDSEKDTGSALTLRTISEASLPLLAGHVRHLLSDGSLGCSPSLLSAASEAAAERSPQILSDLYLTSMYLRSTTASGTTPEARTFTIPAAHLALSMLWAPLQSLQSTSSVIPSSSTNLWSQVLSASRHGTSFFEGLPLVGVIVSWTGGAPLLPCARP